MNGRAKYEAELYAEALVIMQRERKASASLLQRRLQINYNTAVSILLVAQGRGAVSAPDERGARTVLLPEQLGDRKDGESE